VLFIELRFVAFFVVAFCVHWLLPSQRARKIWLLACSYIFYAGWDWRFLGLIFFSTVMDYSFGRALARRRRRSLVVLSIVANLGVLGIFKYYDFFVGSAETALRAAGIDWHPRLLHLILPAGLSFYTFESISYTVNVYRGEKPARSLLDFALYLAFFPHLVAGPILRPSELLPQIEAGPRSFGSVDVRGAVVLFVRGFIKKAVLADTLAAITDRYFEAPQNYALSSAWACVFAYSIQAYCDFSGYTDMARGSARLLGYQLIENFEFPFLARSFSELWNRWHMSLSFWLRDYVFHPLGGARRHRTRNLLVTFFITGLWHGAAWHFVAWGVAHGVLVAGETALRARRILPMRLRNPIGIPVVFVSFVLIAVLFRVGDWPTIATIYRQLFTGSTGTLALPLAFPVFLVGLALVHIAAERRLLAEWWRELPSPVFSAAIGVLAALALAAMQLSYRPFIYFQF
jgi:alginate O-acetyltransferase complex protein AlgI